MAARRGVQLEGGGLDHRDGAGAAVRTLQGSLRERRAVVARVADVASRGAEGVHQAFDHGALALGAGDGQGVALPCGGPQFQFGDDVEATGPRRVKPRVVHGDGGRGDDEVVGAVGQIVAGGAEATDALRADLCQATLGPAFIDDGGAAAGLHDELGGGFAAPARAQDEGVAIGVFHGGEGNKKGRPMPGRPIVAQAQRSVVRVVPSGAVKVARSPCWV